MLLSIGGFSCLITKLPGYCFCPTREWPLNSKFNYGTRRKWHEIRVARCWSSLSVIIYGLLHRTLRSWIFIIVYTHRLAAHCIITMGQRKSISESLVERRRGDDGQPWRHDEIWKIRARDYSVIIIPSMATDLIHSIIHLASVGTPRRETISVIKRAAWLLKYSSVLADASLKSSAGSFWAPPQLSESLFCTRAPTL